MYKYECDQKTIYYEKDYKRKKYFLGTKAIS